MAQKLYAKRKTEALQGKKLPESLRQRTVLFSELIDDALAYSKAKKRSYQDDVCRMGRIREWFGGIPAEDVTVTEIELRLDQLAEEEDLAAATLNRYRSLLSLIFRRAMIAGKASANPARLVTHRQEDNKRIRFLSEAEEAKLRSVICEHWPDREPEFDIALNTGLRRGGMYGLEWQDIDFGHGIATERLTKPGKTRYVPLNDVAISAFLKLREKRDGSGKVFDTRKPRHWFEKAVARASVPDFHWHDLRHTFASRLTMQGTPLRVVQSLMGHGSIVTTTRYSHMEPGFERAAVERLVSFGQQSGHGILDFQERSDTKSDTGQVAIQ